MSSHAFVGTWEVLNCEYLKGNSTFDRYVQRLEGIRVKLDENGDATWSVPEELKSVPLFSCETYEIYRHHSRTGLVIRFGAYAGHVFEFAVDRSWTKENLRLTCEGLCTLHFSRVKDEVADTKYSVQFSLLQALEDGYFSDLTIVASNSKEFKVHKTILQLQGDDVDWSANPPPFSNISEDVLGSILHFLYAECLPENMTEETAKQIIVAVECYPSLKNLIKDCEIYLKNTALKQQIIGLVNDMHSHINQVIESFNSRGSPSENIASNPSKLCFVVKQSIRDFAVVGVKLLLLCDLFTKRKNELSRNERHEIIRYAKSRLPIFLNQLMRFLQALKNTFAPMTPAQRFEVATFLVPEIEVILDTLSMLIVHVEKALNQIMQGLLTSDICKCKSNVGDMMSRTLKNILHIRELTKLNTLHDHITCSLGLIIHKKGHFNQMSSAQKVRAIARNLEQLTEELPIFLIKLEETAAIFDDKLEWRDFKFCFKVATSKVSDILQKLIMHTDSLQEVMQQVCDLVQRPTFTQTLKCLGLLSNNSTASTSSAENLSDSKCSASSLPKHSEYKFNLVEALCTPLDANSSLLSELCLKLLHSEKNTDMEFEITGAVQTSDQSEGADGAASEETCILKSHRVIVAGRCDWFRRALLSGMKEAINRKIIIPDTNPFLFKIFLEYLYSGRLQHSSLTAEQLIDLLLLSDRYEMDALKHTCEYALLKSVDNESALYFLSMADQYNATILKARCLKFVSQCQELTESEEFLELPISLQAEVYEGVWTSQPTKQADSVDVGLEYLLPTSSASSYSSDGVTDLTAAMESMLLAPDAEDQSNASSLDYLHFEQNSLRMDSCISQLRDIVGESAPREELVQVILAADFDMRRAVNFYYAKSNEEEQ